MTASNGKTKLMDNQTYSSVVNVSIVILYFPFLLLRQFDSLLLKKISFEFLAKNFGCLFFCFII